MEPWPSAPQNTVRLGVEERERAVLRPDVVH